MTRSFASGLLALFFVVTSRVYGQGAEPGAEAGPVEHRASLTHEQSRFAQEIEPWQLTSIELLRRSDAGVFLVRGTTARRFGITGRQVELDLYPRITPAVYGYINLGYSGTALFPELRYGAEIFASMQGVELSVGGRGLEFEDQRITLYTSSIGLYRGNYYLMGRSVVAGSDGSSVSGLLLGRRYFREDEFLGLRIGGGATPAQEFTTSEIDRLSSFRVSVDGKTRLIESLRIWLTAGFETEELADERTRSRMIVGVGLETPL